MMQVILFYAFSLLLLSFAIMTVSSRRFFRSAVYLLISLLLTAALYFLLEFNFIAIIQITIYVGGIVVLILFSILLTQSEDANVPKVPWFKKLLGMAVAGSGFFITIYLILQQKFNALPDGGKKLNISEIGHGLLDVHSSGYVFPFEVITVLLLVIMVAGIAVAVKDEDFQNQEQQK